MNILPTLGPYALAAASEETRRAKVSDEPLAVRKERTLREAERKLKIEYSYGGHPANHQSGDFAHGPSYYRKRNVPKDQRKDRQEKRATQSI